MSRERTHKISSTPSHRLVFKRQPSSFRRFKLTRLRVFYGWKVIWLIDRIELKLSRIFHSNFFHYRTSLIRILDVPPPNDDVNDEPSLDAIGFIRILNLMLSLLASSRRKLNQLPTGSIDTHRRREVRISARYGEKTWRNEKWQNWATLTPKIHDDDDDTKSSSLFFRRFSLVHALCPRVSSSPLKQLKQRTTHHPPPKHYTSRHFHSSSWAYAWFE